MLCHRSGSGSNFRQVYQADTGCVGGDFTWGYPGVGATALARAWLHYECGFVAVPDDAPLPPIGRVAQRTLMRATAGWVAALPHTHTGMQWTLESTEFVTWVTLCVTVCMARVPDADALHRMACAMRDGSSSQWERVTP